jgi:hypothetical protein
MLKIDKATKKLVSLGSPAPGSLASRLDLSEYIANSPGEFFDEVGLKVLLIGRKVRPAPNVPVVIDLLGLDPQGQAVVIVLQSSEQSPLARAIAAAGLIASWKPADFFEGMSEQRVGELVASLEVDLDQVNRKQRAVLIAESYDFEGLAATRWLRERYGMDLTCLRVSLTVDPRAGAEFLTCTNLSEPASSPVAEIEPEDDQPPAGGGPAERRQHPRTRKYRADSLRLDYAGRALGAKLVDLSEGGVGLEMLGPLPLGSSVNLTGELRSADDCMELQGSARVAHCQYPEDSVFRIGLSFADMRHKKVECPEETDPGRSFAAGA